MPTPSLSSIPQPPFGSSPLARPSGNPGEAANAVSMVHEAIDMLEKALAGLPIAHPLHKVVLSTISNLSKHAPAQAASPGVGLQQLKQLLAQKMQGSPLAALMGGAGGAPGGAPPPAMMGGGAPGGAPPPAMMGGGAPTPTLSPA